MPIPRALSISAVSGLAACAALALVSPWACPPARAQGPWPSIDTPPAKVGGGERDVALVVSIEDYAKLPDVAGAEANARAWVRWFEKTRGLRSDKVVWLKDSEGTPSEMLAKAAELGALADPKGMIWVVFIGHGAPSEDSTEGVLVGWAAQQSARELYGQSVPQSALVAALGGGRSAPITLVVDACFSGKGRAGEALVPGLQPVLLANRGQALPPQVTVLSAGRSDQFAGPLPGEERPAFSYLLLGALRGWGDDAQYGNGDQQVTVAEALEFTRAALRTTLKGRSQTPEVLGAPGLVLARKAAERAPDLGAIRDAQAPEERPAALGGGAKEVGGGLDLNLDLDALTQAQKLKDAIDRAKATDTNERATPMQKAEAWDAVASLSVRGQNPYAAEARQNAASWRAVAAEAGELREHWAKVKEALKLSVLDLGQKKELVGKLLSAYSGLSSEGAYQEAKQAKQALDGGNAFPLGGGAAAKVVGSASAPKGYVEIPAGRFTMGSPSDEPGRRDDEVAHEVRVTRPFWLKATEVTVAEWRALMGRTPGWYTACGDACPVHAVNWFEAIAYVNALSRREGLDSCYEASGCTGVLGGSCSDEDIRTKGYCVGDYTCSEVRFKGLGCTGYRLPTEAEWEHAARAGTSTALYTGPLTLRGKNHGPELDAIAWYGGNSGVGYDGAADCSGWPEKQREAARCGPHPVGGKRPNAWGLYDMLGNVWEWVHDWYGPYAGSATDPLGPSSGGDRVCRGGSWNFVAGFVRAAGRSWNSPSLRGGGLGFRPARSVP